MEIDRSILQSAIGDFLKFKTSKTENCKWIQKNLNSKNTRSKAVDLFFQFREIDNQFSLALGYIYETTKRTRKMNKFTCIY